MKKFLYIGIHTAGTTSRQRADHLQKLLPGWEFRIIDTHIPFYQTPRIWRSLGFRLKKGPLISSINRYILQEMGNESFDVIWVDKAVFIREITTRLLRKCAPRLIHFTPDPAFRYHSSSHFYHSLPCYDYVVTTKSYELEDYRKYLPEEKIILTTQGFDPELHRPYHTLEEKEFGVSFLGRFEKEREKLLEKLLEAGIPLILAGNHWEGFVKRHRHHPGLNYRGKGLYGKDYAFTLSRYYFSLGLISKWIPEQHTTRTFEIPACGTILVTEKNEEMLKFFGEKEVVYFDNPSDLVNRLKSLCHNLEELKRISREGQLAVSQRQSFAYPDLLYKILTQTGLLHG